MLEREQPLFSAASVGAAALAKAGADESKAERTSNDTHFEDCIKTSFIFTRRTDGADLLQLNQTSFFMICPIGHAAKENRS